MGLMDMAMGALNGAFQDKNLMQAASELLSNDSAHGGLSGLVGKFQQAGLSDVVSSWIGRGENLPVSADQISQVLGSNAVAGIAEKFGLNAQDLSSGLAQHLPGLVDKLTPQGQMPEGGLGNASDLLGALGSLLKS
jgi:uncharacterized protein YidB (DUF937 family)